MNVTTGVLGGLLPQLSSDLPSISVPLIHSV